ncbi:hypothetical protein PRZ48_009576 [Zasmidium cellare]|uniref:SnoaL-like domain-containing protein n=1 Tax=Zasmidium cellare TaxID=395010 RepID=A0ABR0ECG7_ZASCE|nr:hypothetical protein PRZ48_009576 [Zasmidium cellare]
MASNLTTTHLTPQEAIIDAQIRMVQALDDNDPDLLASAFTPTATYDLRPFSLLGLEFGLLSGRDNIVPTLLAAVGKMDTTHTLSNFRTKISSDGKSAHLTCYTYAQHFRPGQGQPHAFGNGFLMGNRYEGDLVLDESGGIWRFERFVLWCVWSQGDFGEFEDAVKENERK